MGRVTLAEAAAPSATLKHFTHPHDLHPLSLYNPQTLCSGCKLQSSGTMYACTPCNFTLHKSCANLPQLISHPSHGGCILSLLTAAAYPGGRFSCNACALTDDSWHYHCDRCDYDLHVTCASKPLKIKHRSHTSCALDLELTFKNPYMDAKGFSCDVCRKIGTKQWLYRCNSCEFDVHLDCTSAAPPQPALQQQRSAPPPPAETPLHRVQFTHSASSGAMSARSQFPAPPQVNGLVQPHLMHSASAGAIGNPYGGNLYRPHWGVGGNPAAAMNNGRVGNGVAARVGALGGNMAVSALQGIVQSAVQGVGQMVAEDVIGVAGDILSSAAEIC